MRLTYFYMEVSISILGLLSLALINLGAFCGEAVVVKPNNVIFTTDDVRSGGVSLNNVLVGDKTPYSAALANGEFDPPKPIRVAQLI